MVLLVAGAASLGACAGPSASSTSTTAPIANGDIALDPPAQIVSAAADALAVVSSVRLTVAVRSGRHRPAETVDAWTFAGGDESGTVASGSSLLRFVVAAGVLYVRGNISYYLATVATCAAARKDASDWQASVAGTGSGFPGELGIASLVSSLRSDRLHASTGGETVIGGVDVVGVRSSGSGELFVGTEPPHYPLEVLGPELTIHLADFGRGERPSPPAGAVSSG
jgi:hypothetical protein